MEKIMQPVNKNFSWPRFKALMKSDFLINKGTYVKLAATVIGCFIALAILISILAMNDINSFIKLNASTMSDLNLEGLIKSRRYSYSSILLTLCLWVVSIALTIFGSLTFSSLGSKKQRISTFMLPASLSAVCECRDQLVEQHPPPAPSPQVLIQALQYIPTTFQANH